MPPRPHHRPSKSAIYHLGGIYKITAISVYLLCFIEFPLGFIQEVSYTRATYVLPPYR